MSFKFRLQSGTQRRYGTYWREDLASQKPEVTKIVLAEKASDLMRGRRPLPLTDVPVYIAPNWDTSQR